MNICFVAHSFPPFIGGGETHVYLLAKAFHERGHAVTVITGVSRQHAIVEDAHPFRVVRVQNFLEFERGKVGFREFLGGFQEALQSAHFDVVHVHNFMPALAYAAVTSARRVRTIFTFHSTPIPEEGKILGHFSSWELEQAFASFVLGLPFYEYVACPSRYYYQWALRLGASQRKTRLVHHGIDADRFQIQPSPDWRREHGYAEDDFIVVCAARMIARKGIVDLLRAFREIPDKRIKLYLASSVLNGSEEYCQHVFRTITECELQNRVRVSLDQDSFLTMPMVLGNSNCFVLPSYAEGFGVVLLEAMAARVPVIGSKVCGIDEVIRDGVNGLFVEPHNPHDIAEKILMVVSNNKLAATIMNGGRRTVQKKFSLSKKLDLLEQLYRG